MDLSKLLYKIIGKDGTINNINRIPKDIYLKVSDFFKEEVIVVCIGTNMD